MKRMIAVTIALFMLLSTAGCSRTIVKETAPVQPSATQTDAPPEKTESSLGGNETVPTEPIMVKSYKNLNKKASGLKDGQTTFVGLGYNILDNSYIHMEGFSNGRPILKESEVQSRLKTKSAPVQNSHTIMGQTLKSYCDNFSIQLELKSSYPLFTGKITSEFDKSQTNKSNVYFIKSLSGYPKNSEYINVTNDLKDILDETFKGDLNGDMSPEDLFTTYGTHLVVEALMGARCEYNYTYSSTETQTMSQVKLKVDAAYKFISGSGSIDDKKVATEFLSNSSFTSSLSGGKDIDASTLENLVKNMPVWIESLAAQAPTIYGISNINSLIPVWELATDATRKIELQDAFKKQGGSIQAFIDSMSNIPEPKPTPPPAQTYIQSIMILSDKDDITAQAQLFSGYKRIAKDLNNGAKGNYIYLSYNTTTDPTKALTDIRITYNSFSLTKPYTKNAHDINAGAGGDFIYLWTSTSAASGKPIRVIDLFYGKNADMPTGYTGVDYNKTGKVAELNHNAGGDFIYLGIKR